MSISKTDQKINLQSGMTAKTTLAFVVLVLSLTFSAFALGRLSSSEKEKSVEIQTTAPTLEAASFSAIEPEESNSPVESASNPSEKQEGFLLGSVNSDKYHFPWCPGGQRIHDENKIWFDSYEEARAAGYIPAKNCEGLE